MATLSILGAGREVGRSSFLLDATDKVLLDRGVKIMPDTIEYPLPLNTNINAAIISHAHLDHSGNLPHLFLRSTFLTFLTQPTLDLSKMLWFDALKIAGLEGMVPEFTEDEIALTEKFAFPVRYKSGLDITENIYAEFFDAGHILGSMLTKLHFENKTLLYTGDFNPSETRLFKGADLNVGKVDIVVIEGTYGDRDHPPRRETEKIFYETVEETIAKGGIALVPAFAVARSQELVEVLAEYNVSAEIYLDGMAQKASRIFMDYPSYLKTPKKLKKALKKAIWIKNSRMRKKIVKKPCVIITTSGMLQGGPVQHYLKHIYKDKNSSILLTGYQVEGTPGRILLETGKIQIEDGFVDVEATVRKFDFSAHASQSDMLYALKKWSPERVIIVHADSDVADIFKDRIKEEIGIDATIAENGMEIEL
ncbi:MAG: MBL fold metallo-hydrolase [Candidatus Diapherotrites archaeon]|nr:MBL fold metallo-hydrolase [Candidatus Diapherotrites archaeon]